MNSQHPRMRIRSLHHPCTAAGHAPPGRGVGDRPGPASRCSPEWWSRHQQRGVLCADDPVPGSSQPWASLTTGTLGQREGGEWMFPLLGGLWESPVIGSALTRALKAPAVVRELTSGRPGIWPLSLQVTGAVTQPSDIRLLVCRGGFPVSHGRQCCG